MRFARSASASAILIITGCASYSATLVQQQKSDAGPDAGNQTGGNASTGGASSTSGANAGGNVSTGGASSTSGANAGGNSSPGGNASTGGRTSAGGTGGIGGTNGCTKDADCVNSDPTNCSFTCVNPGSAGVCKPAATITPTKCATTACDDKAISGFWDAQGKPHIAFGWTDANSSATIRMQQLNLDGTLYGAAVPFNLPALQTEPALLSAAAQANKIAFLWSGVQGNTGAAPNGVVQFGFTDATGASFAPNTLDSGSGGLGVQTLALQVTPAGAWLALESASVSGAFWEAATGSSIAAWTGMSPPFDGQLAAGVLGNTLMLTGANCLGATGCQRSFILQRYSVANLSTIGDPITLSQNFDGYSTPAMGPMLGQMAILWNEKTAPGQLLRAIVKEDGTFAQASNAIASNIQTKALVESSAGGALLVGTIASGTPTMYQLVGQRFDATLSLVGAPLPLGDSQSSDTSGVELHASSDGSQVLVTYRQVGARYRVLGTNFCHNP